MATSEDLPDLIVYAMSVPETIEIAKDVAQKLVESYIEHDDELSVIHLGQRVLIIGS